MPGDSVPEIIVAIAAVAVVASMFIKTCKFFIKLILIVVLMVAIGVCFVT